MLEIIKTTLKGMGILLIACLILFIPATVLYYFILLENGLYLAILLMGLFCLHLCYITGIEFQERKERRNKRPPK